MVALLALQFVRLFSATIRPKTYKKVALSQRKDDRAMRPIHGSPENFRDSLTMPTATILSIFMGFCSDRPYK